MPELKARRVRLSSSPTTGHARPIQGPSPLGQELLKRLQLVEVTGVAIWNDASAQHERLRRMGYLTRQARGRDWLACITDAGSAYLERQP